MTNEINARRDREREERRAAIVLVGLRGATGDQLVADTTRYQDLAEMLGVTWRTVARDMRDLQAAGYVRLYYEGRPGFGRAAVKLWSANPLPQQTCGDFGRRWLAQHKIAIRDSADEWIPGAILANARKPIFSAVRYDIPAVSHNQDKIGSLVRNRTNTQSRNLAMFGPPGSLRDPGDSVTDQDQIAEGVRAFVLPTLISGETSPADPAHVHPHSPASQPGLPVAASDPRTPEEIGAERQRRHNELLREIHGEPTPRPAPAPKPIPPERRLPREDDADASADVVFTRRPWTDRMSWWDSWHDFTLTWDRFVVAVRLPQALIDLGREEQQVCAKLLAAGYPAEPMRFRAIRRDGGRGEVYGLQVAIGAKGKRLKRYRFIVQADNTVNRYDDEPIVTDAAKLARLYPQAAAYGSRHPYQEALRLLTHELAKHDYCPDELAGARLRRARRLAHLIPARAEIERTQTAKRIGEW